MLDSPVKVKSRHKHRRVYVCDDVVVKEFDHLADFEPELSAYKDLSSIIQDVNLGKGWLLKTPEIINVESKEKYCIKMECMPGDTIDELCFNKEQAPWRLIGKALGLFHYRVFSLYNKEKIYYDFSLHNVMCSVDDRIVSFIDPGHLFLTEEKKSNDVYLFLWSMLVYRFKGARIPLEAERKFLKGYLYSNKINRLNGSMGSILKDVRNIFTLRIDKEHEKDSLPKKIIYNILKSYFVITRTIMVYMKTRKLKD